MFINFTPERGLEIRPYRHPKCVAGDITDLVIDLRFRDIAVSCPLDGAKEALEDGRLWKDDDQEAIEEAHAAILEHERGAA